MSTGLQNTLKIPHPFAQKKERLIWLSYVRVFESEMKHQNGAARTSETHVHFLRKR